MVLVCEEVSALISTSICTWKTVLMSSTFASRNEVFQPRGDAIPALFTAQSTQLRSRGHQYFRTQNVDPAVLLQHALSEGRNGRFVGHIKLLEFHLEAASE